MKKPIIIANWKANKTTQEAIAWFQHLADIRGQLADDKVVVICPGFHLLSTVKTQIQHFNLVFNVGAQDISSFSAGAHTGEVPAEFAREFATYVLIGHSERREQLHELDELLERKVRLALPSGLQVIYCVRGLEDVIPQGVTLVAYEPVGAIGSGQPDTPENAQDVAEQIKQNYPQVQAVIYGGSVSAENVSLYTSQAAIDGVLVGGASLDAASFSEIIRNS